MQTKPLAEVTQVAIRVLVMEIGLVDKIRFAGQFTVGYGDYTAERDELFGGMTLDDMLTAIKQRRSRAGSQLAQVTEKTLHRAVDTGPAVGGEAW